MKDVNHKHIFILRWKQYLYTNPDFYTMISASLNKSAFEMSTLTCLKDYGTTALRIIYQLLDTFAKLWEDSETSLKSFGFEYLQTSLHV